MSNIDIYPDNLAHLKDELRRLDLLIEHAFARSRSLRGRESIAGPYISETEVRGLLSVSRLEGSDDADSTADRIWEKVQAHTLAIRERMEASQTQGVRLLLPRLARIFGLSPFESDVLVVCLAPEMDLKYQRLFGFLHDDATRRHASIALVQKLLCITFEEEVRARGHFGQTAPLVRYRLISLSKGAQDLSIPLPAHPLMIDAGIAGHLLEESGLDPLLAGHATLIQPEAIAEKIEDADLPGRNSCGRIVGLIEAYLAGEISSQLIFHFSGQDGESKRHTAESVCRKLSVAVIQADFDAIQGDPAELLPLVARVLRSGLLQPAAVFMENCDRFLESDERSPCRLKSLLQLIREMGWIVFITAKRPWPPQELYEDQALLEFDFPVPDFAARRSLWSATLTRDRRDSGDLNLDDLAATFRLTGRQIRNAALVARNRRLARGKTNGRADLKALRAAARTCSSQNLKAFGRKIVPRYSWQDIVLPPDTLAQLQEFCGNARCRRQVYGRWGFNRKHSLGKGQTILFSGDSGTGKTMAAEIIAKDLGLDLFKIDLSTVVSKYIGETEKNLSRIFEEAETSNAILFFDEADALYGKRSEVKDSHDRYANIEINYLLQKLDEHEGIVILATNLSRNIDEAFVRRLQYAVTFPMPERRQRLLIWQGVFPRETPLDPDLDFAFLAKQFDITGGSIKNIALRAALLAVRNSGAVHMKHIIRATKREFQKMGRLCLESEFKQYYDLLK